MKIKNIVKSFKLVFKQCRRWRSVVEGNDEVVEDGDDDNVVIEIIVQCFVNFKKCGGVDDGEDLLYLEILFVNWSGESIVDVFV